MWLSIVLSTFFPPRSIFVEFKTNNKIIYVRKSWLFEELSLIITLSWESSLRKSCLQIWSGSQKRSTCIIIYFINIYMYMLKVALSCTCMLPEDRQIDDWECIFHYFLFPLTCKNFFVRRQPVSEFLSFFPPKKHKTPLSLLIDQTIYWELPKVKQSQYHGLWRYEARVGCDLCSPWDIVSSGTGSVCQCLTARSHRVHL